MPDELDDNRESNESADAAEDAASVDVQDERDPVEVLNEEVAALKDKNLRLLAELRNVQQRAQRDKQEALRFADADFARELLPVVDDLERTLESARDASDVAAVVEGVRITYDHLMKVLKARHVEAIDAAGEAFDPNVHEAMLQQPSEEHESGVVLQEVARGYKLHERVLRSSKVIVSSGPAAGDDQNG